VWVEFLREVARRILPEEKVRSRAYEFWRARDRPDGSPDEDWYRAESTLRNELILDPLMIVDSVMEAKKPSYVLAGMELPSSASLRVFRRIFPHVM
jgi:hypothetical protein